MTTKEILKLAKALRKQITKDFHKCRTFSIGCASCQAHKVADNVVELAEWLDALSKM